MTWCGEGLEPDGFWRQTPRTFVAIMEGRVRAASRAVDLAVIAAWHTEAFARQKRLKKLSAYLSDAQGQKPDPVLELKGMFQRMQAKGKFAKITKLPN